MLFGSYRRTDASDPDLYVAAITAVLSMYDTDLIREVTDPRTGIAATEKHMSFLPNAGELKVYCDGVAARRDRIQRLGSLPKPDFSRARLAAPPAGPGAYANTFVPDNHARYARLVELAASADPRQWKFGKSSDGRAGIWVARNLWDDVIMPTSRAPAPAEPRSLQLSEAELKAMREVDETRPIEPEQRSEVA